MIVIVGDEGSVSAEYVMIAAGIAGVLLVIVSALGGRISDLYTIGMSLPL